MKKMCSRVLAMLLTVVMMLSVLPLSVFASWLDVEAENTQSGNTVSSDIKVTVSAKEFLSYLKNGDLKGLLTGVSVEGLRGVVSAEELLEIIPKEQFKKLVDLIVSDVKSIDLAKYIDMEMLLESVDMDALVALVKDIPNLQDYVKDYDALMEYIDKDMIADAVDYIDVDALVDDYADDLIDLALTLPAEDLAKIVDVNAALELDEIDFSAVLDVEYFKALENYMDYIDEDGLHDFIVKLYDDPAHRLDSETIHHFIDDDLLADILMDPANGYLDHLGDFIDPEALKELVKDKKYAELKAYLDIDAFIDTIVDSNLSYSELKAKGAIDTDKLFAAVEGLTYVQLKNSGALDTKALFDRVEGLEYSVLESFVDTDALFPMIEGLSYADLEKSGALNTDVLHGLIEGLTYAQLKNSGALNTDKLHGLIEGLSYAELKASGALSADDIFGGYADFAPYLDNAKAEAFLRDKFTMAYLEEKGYINGAALDIDAMYAAGEFSVDELIDADALTVSIEDLIFDENGAYYYEKLIEEGKLVPTALFTGAGAKWTVEGLIDSEVILPKALFVGNDAVWSVESLIDAGAILPKALFVGDDAIWSVEELIDGNIINAKALFVGDKALWDVEELVDANVIEPTKLINGANAPLDMDKLVEDGAILPDALLFDSSADANGNTKPYYFGNLVKNGIVNIKVIVNGDEANNIPVLFKIIDLEKQGVIDFKKLAFGDPGDPDDSTDDVKGLFEDIDVLLKNDVFDLNGMLHEWTDDEGIKHAPLFTFEELIAEGVVLEDKMIADGHTYDKLVDIAALEEQLKDLLAEGKLTTDDIFSCLVKKDGKPDYAAAIDAVGGVEAIIESTDLTYTAILTDYVTDFSGLMNEIGVEETVQAIVADGKLETVFDVNGLIDAIGTDKLMELVDVKEIARELINKEVILDVIRSLSPKAYLAWVSELLNVLSRNILAIEINGVTITEKPFSDVLVFNSEKLLACVEAAIPTLHDLATLDEEGRLLNFSFGITYASEATGGVAKTKKIGVSFCLAEGTDMIRKTAATIEKLLGKFLSYSYSNGDFAVNVKIPDEFASVIAYALNTLGADADPELIKLKDDLLGLYDANLSDMANFVGNVTFGQIITILEKVDSEHFERAYNAVLRQRYVALMVDFIAEATGTDLSDLPLDVLVRKLENIPALPKLEQVAEKVESITGRDLVSKLPQRVQNVWVTAEGELVTDLLSRLGARYGADFDLQGILETVAGQEDPIGYVYDALIAKMEMAGYVYNAASDKLMAIADRALASSIGQKLDTIHLNNYYRENGTFGFNVDFTFSPEKVLKKGIDKVMNFVLSKREFNTEYIDGALSIVYGLISDSPVTLSFDASVTFSGLYKAEFYNENGELIRKVFLPAGANLALMMGEYAPIDPKATFVGWKDATIDGDVYYTAMPYADMKFIADVDTKDEPVIPEEETVTVTVINPEGEIVKEIVLEKGESLAASLEELEALVGTLEANQTLTWHAVVDGVAVAEEYDFDAAIYEDMTLTWKITTTPIIPPETYYNVNIYDPANLNAPYLSLSILERKSLMSNDDFVAFYSALKDANPDKIIVFYEMVNGVPTENAFDLSNSILSDVDLVWNISGGEQPPEPPVPPVDVYYDVFVDVYDENGQFLFELPTQSFLENTTVGDIVAALDAILMSHEDYIVLEDWENHIYDLIHIWVNEEGKTLDMAAKLNGQLVLTVVIARDHANAGLKLNTSNIHYSIDYLAPYYIVTWGADAWDDTMELTIAKDFLANAVANGGALVMRSLDDFGGQRISLDAKLLENLLAKMNELGVESVVLSYSFDKVDATSGANIFSFSFLFDDVAVGDFFGEGKVEIRMPFATQNSVKAKTFLYIDGVETVIKSIANGYVVLDAPHFSEFKLVNKYQLSYAAHEWEGVDENLLGDLANLDEIATKPLPEGYYEAGEEITFTAATVLPVAEGVELLRIQFVGSTEYFLPDSVGTYTMPAKAVTLRHIVTIKTYYIYYYVGGALESSRGYTKFSVPTWEEIEAYVPADVAAGTWFGIDKSLNLAENLQDLYLFLTWEGEEKNFSMTFKILDANGNEVTFTITHTVGEWLSKNLALLNTEIDAALLNLGVQDNRAITWLNAGEDLNDYTIDAWEALMGAADEIIFVGRYEERKYTVYTDGNLTLNVGDSVAAGTVIEFTVIEKAGMKATVIVIVNGIETVLTGNTYEMPATDVTFKVTYAPKTYSYTNANGTVVDNVLFGDRITFTVTVPAGKVLPTDINVAQLAGAPNGLALISMKADADGNLILTYAFNMTEESNGISLASFVATVENYIVDIEYKNVYVVDGKSYPSKEAAEAALPEGVVVKKWKQIDTNLFVAVLAYEAEEGPAGLIVLIIVLIVLILILLIALLYTLYICGKIGTNWFLKVIVAIVNVFFKACMAVAAAGVAIARLLGYEEADPTVDAEDAEPAFAEITEEVAEEATEEVVEEAVEEATEEVVEEATEEAAEEATEEDETNE